VFHVGFYQLACNILGNFQSFRYGAPLRYKPREVSTRSKKAALKQRFNLHRKKEFVSHANSISNGALAGKGAFFSMSEDRDFGGLLIGAKGQSGQSGYLHKMLYA
jgi:hypothetical protein